MQQHKHRQSIALRGTDGMIDKPVRQPTAAFAGRSQSRLATATLLLGIIGLVACSSPPANPARKPTSTLPPPAASTQPAAKPVTKALPVTTASTAEGQPGASPASRSMVTSVTLPPPGAKATSTATVRPAEPHAGATAVTTARLASASPAAQIQSTTTAPAAAAASPTFAIARSPHAPTGAGAPVQNTVATDSSVARSASGVATNPEAPDEVIGDLKIYSARYEDTLLDIALDNDLGFLELVAANQGVDPWLPGAGTKVMLPKARIEPNGPREGIVINIPEQRMYFYQKGVLVDTYPIGVFRDGFSTPIGSTRIVRKTVDPTWYPTKSSREEHPELPAAVPSGPDNPLGSRAMYLGWARYIIHGTNKPYGVGRRVSHGCIRMQPQDVEALYDMAPVGTRVHTLSQTIKVGWWRGELFLQAHPTLEQGISLEETGKIDPIDVPDVREKVTAKAGAFADRVDWTAVETALKERRGIPVQITNRQSPVAAVPPTPSSPLLGAKAGAAPVALATAQNVIRQ